MPWNRFDVIESITSKERAWNSFGLFIFVTMYTESCVTQNTSTPPPPPSPLPPPSSSSSSQCGCSTRAGMENLIDFVRWTCSCVWFDGIKSSGSFFFSKWRAKNYAVRLHVWCNFWIIYVVIVVATTHPTESIKAAGKWDMHTIIWGVYLCVIRIKFIHAYYEKGLSLSLSLMSRSSTALSPQNIVFHTQHTIAIAFVYII